MRQPRYPVYVPSKGRAHTPLTVKFMQRDRLPFRLVVEPQEADRYAGLVGDTGQLLVLPESDQGLLFAATGSAAMQRRKAMPGTGRSVTTSTPSTGCTTGAGSPARLGRPWPWSKTSRIATRNIGIAGLNYEMFVPVETTRQPPLVFNVHVYSCTLISHAMPCRWRCLYNDDTDLCLQALAAGWCTVLMNVFVAKKRATMTVRAATPMTCIRAMAGW